MLCTPIALFSGLHFGLHFGQRFAQAHRDGENIVLPALGSLLPLPCCRRPPR
ncbi:hypothetical protein [Deinococcus sp.]|uniref:hypothetical protein n=1 Tax=Deinococcus sp. TaxID=47478 RepID=UPI0025C21C0D|nr:hypothetical protein [Deinococcus sp.]